MRRLPGLESSNNNKEAEDIFYNTMMSELLRRVVGPLLSHGKEQSGAWVQVRFSSVDPAVLRAAPQTLVHNLFAWKAFTRKKEHRSKILCYP